MPPPRRRKLALTLLVLYWPTFFIVSHIPIPDLVRGAGLSDKTLHFLAYMVLVFLLWSTVRPYERVNWLKAPAWLILVVVVWYGVADELLQAKVGRTADVKDFAADVVGVLAGLLILSQLTFWPAFLIVTAINIFAMTNLAIANVSELAPRADVAFGFLAYALFTAVWVRNVAIYLALRPPRLKWIATSLSLPIALLVATRTCSEILQKSLGLESLIVALVAIGATTAVYPLITALYTSIFPAE